MLSPSLSQTHILLCQSAQNCALSPANICRRQSNLAAGLFADGTADPDAMWWDARARMSFLMTEGNNKVLFKPHHPHHNKDRYTISYPLCCVHCLAVDVQVNHAIAFGFIVMYIH